MSESTETSSADETLTTDDGQLDQDKLFSEEFAKLTGQPVASKEEEEPAAKPEPEEQEDSPDASAEQAQQDWFDGLPEDAQKRFQELMQQHQALESNYRALHNRLAPTQRKLAEAQRRLQEMTTPQTQLAQGDASDKKSEQREKQNELWSKIKETDPTLAEGIEEEFNKRLAALEQQLEQKLRPFQERTYNEDLSREVRTLVSFVPNAVEIFESPDFNGWLDAQPENIQKLFQSPDHRDALSLLKLYDSDVQRWEMDNQPAQQATPEASKVQERRTSRLQNPLPAAGKPASPKKEELNEYALFEKVWADELKRTSVPLVSRR